MIPKLYNLSQASDKVVGYVQKKYNFFNDLRIDNGLPFFRKVILLHDSTVIILNLSDAGSITITAGFPEILLFSGSSSSGYSYSSDCLSPAILSGDISLPLFSMFDGRIQLNDQVYTQYKSGWKNGDIGSELIPLGRLNDNELGFFAQGNNIFGRNFDSLYEYGNVSHQSSILEPEFCGAYGNLFNANYKRQDTPWNLLSTNVVYAINPINKKRIDSYYWIPSLFSVAPADPYGMFGGFYYGEYPSSQYGFTSNEYGWFQQPLIKAEIRLKGFLDTKYSHGSYSYGYAELVEYIEYQGGIEHPNDLYIYAQGTPLSPPSNSYFYNESVYGSRADASMTIGWEGKGFSSIAKVNVDGFTNPDVYLWNFENWQNPDSFMGETPDEIGVIISDATHCTLLRTGSYTTTIYESSEYHSHAVSNDGTLVAIFEGTELISRIVLYDLFGKKEKTKYVSGTPTQIIISEVVASVEAMSGAFIPFRKDDFDKEKQQSAIDILSVSSIDQSDLGNYMDDSMPSMAILNFIKSGLSHLGIKKCKIENGLATYEVGQNECFTDTVYVVDPESTDVRSKQISEWYVGGGIKGLVRGEFTGIGDSAGFRGLNDFGTVIDTISMPEHFYIFESQYGGFVFERNFGEVQLGACLEMGTDVFGSPAPVLTEACADNARCGETITITASADCGQTAEMHYNIETDPLYITGDENFGVGSGYSVHGGAGPYSWSCAGGYTVSESTDSISITDTSGICGTINISATDHCGNTTIFEARADGHWVLQSDGGNPPWYTGWMVGTEISGGSKVVKLYTPAGCICFPDMIYLSPAGSCHDYNPYCSEDKGDVSGYWWGTADTFGGFANCKLISTPAKKRFDIPGFSSTHSSQGVSDNFCLTNAGTNYHYYAFAMYSHDPRYDKVYRWECP